jgi:DNA-binding GntR family transcriptional regulator
MKMTRLKQESLADNTVIALRDAIFSGKYLPGQRLVEEEVAGQLGVSRIVVREAFSYLKSQGLAAGEHNRGKSVAVLSMEDIAELIPLRLLMESLAATWAARRITNSGADMLRKHITKFSRKLPNYSTYVELDFEIHRAIWDLAGNKQLVVMLERLAGPMIGLASRVYAPMLNELVLKEREAREGSHCKIVDAICAGQPEEARHAMQTHILSNWRISLNMSSGGELYDASIEHGIQDAVALVDSLAGIMESTMLKHRAARKK